MARPAASPSGDEIAFFQSFGPQGYQVVVVNRLGGRERRLTNGRGTMNVLPTWTPDGESVLFVHEHPPPTSLRRVSRLGGPPTVVLEGANASSHNGAMSSPDGRRLVFSHHTGEVEKTMVLDLETGATTELPEPHLHEPQWSADGEEVLGFRHDGTVVLCRIGARACREVVERAAWAAKWTPDRRGLYFPRASSRHASSRDVGVFDLWLHELDTGEERKVGELRPVYRLAPSYFDVSVTGL